MAEVREDIASQIMDITNDTRYADYLPAVASVKSTEDTVVSIFVYPDQIYIYTVNPLENVKLLEKGKNIVVNGTREIPAQLHYDSGDWLCDISADANKSVGINPAVIVISTEKDSTELLDIIEESVNNYISESPKYFTRGC